MADEYDIQAILTDLKEKTEMQADQHDGCYELMRTTINAYAKLSDLSVLDYKDLNLIYLTTVGTWKQGLDSKKKTIHESHLSPQEKTDLIKLWDDIWNKAGQQVYSNSNTSNKHKRSIGLFGTGFFSFGNDTSSEKVQSFISMLIDILPMTDDDEMFKRAEEVLSSSFPGMQAAAASMILHCLKPYSFPVLNSNSGHNNIFEVLGIKLSNVYTLETYIDNCRKIKKYRDNNFPYKNYRIFDIEAQNVDRFKIDSVDQEIYGFSEMVSFLSTYSGVHYTTPEKAGENASYMTEIKNRGQEARQKLIIFAKKIVSLFPDLEYDSCSQWKNQGQTVERYLWVELKNSKWKNYPQSVSISIERHDDVYPGEGYYLSIRAETRDVSSKPEDYKRQMRLLDCSLSDGMTYRTKHKNQEYVYHGTDRDKVKKLCDNGTIFKVEIIEAIENLPEKDNEGSILSETLKAVKEIYPLYDYVMQHENYDSQPNNSEFNSEENNVMEQLAHNIILYGPPGTGKTYNTAIYAVAICDNLSLDEVMAKPYDEVLERYRFLKNKEKRVAFTTFHQSYGYEEFIEGIKPLMASNIESGDSNDVKYDVIPGVFKEFCTRAANRNVETTEFNIAEDASVWKVTVRSKVIQDCFDNNRVRIDWDFGTNGARSFIYNMASGDIIITTDGNRRRINGIAVITEDAAYELDSEKDKTARKVKWLAKENLDIDITDINAGKMLHRMTVARVPNMKVSDVVAIAKEKNHDLTDTIIQDNTNPYVFIIDEINRGNISKIFGELITLIEETKRAGADEAMEATLPYSGDLFSVPNNVYILGTMNTADRSIALMDTALRRRFQFEEMLPNPQVLRNIGADKVIDGDVELDVAEMLEIINKRIEYLYDREHTIGHAFFTELKGDGANIHKLSSIFKKSVLPLLQEYFYEDYSKIRMVLGDNGKEKPEHMFILAQKIETNHIFRGDTSDVDIPEYSYTIQDKAFDDIMSYKGIIG
ncbi:AAA family ATPase [uncultured Ruminococcus sp.]|uniref:AAA family ATPase n=1 Tax=uncultured Ruminococcus sp. TaxID=165186 RepID=UPI002638DBF5|nr:AAA family ATPase [uncultured Ruminococcus sp.]